MRRWRLPAIGPLRSISHECQDFLELEFLPLRAKLLDIAATFDRLDRADGGLATIRGWRECASDGDSCLHEMATVRSKFN